MSQQFPTAQDTQSLSQEITCLKIMMACMLKSMGQVDAGKSMIKMDRYLSCMEEGTEKVLFVKTLQQIKDAYLA